MAFQRFWLDVSVLLDNCHLVVKLELKSLIYLFKVFSIRFKIAWMNRMIPIIREPKAIVPKWKKAVAMLEKIAQQGSVLLS